MDTATETTSGKNITSFGANERIPGILVAFAPVGSYTTDRCLLAETITVGRGKDCELCIRDSKISSRHLCITRESSQFMLEDLGSTNGTFVDGLPVRRKVSLGRIAVIRAGRAVLVFHRDAVEFMQTPPSERYGMAGRFHIGPLLGDLGEAATSARHVLLSGPTGTGKELAARAIAGMMGNSGDPLPLLAYNAARIASSEEAMSTLFGVVPRFFSNVDARRGMIEQASGGALLIDEVHNLPAQTQRSLLRIIEDGKLARLGENVSRPVDVRFIFASNVSGKTNGLTNDLFARLRRVEIPPLAERAADVPAIFDAVLGAALEDHQKDSVPALAELSGDHYEALCLDSFAANNVRGLVDLADRIATRMVAGAEPKAAITHIFSDRFGDGLVASRRGGEGRTESSRYEQNKPTIIATFRECGGNLTETERQLKSRGLRCSRRWLAVFLEKWGER